MNPFWRKARNCRFTWEERMWVFFGSQSFPYTYSVCDSRHSLPVSWCKPMPSFLLCPPRHLRAVTFLSLSILSYFHPFQADISPVGCAAALCGRLPQETSPRRRKHHTPPCLVIQPTAQQTMAVTMVLHHKSGCLWCHTLADTWYFCLKSFPVLAPVLCCGNEWCFPLFRKSAERSASWGLPVLTKANNDLFTLSQWNGLVHI